MPKEKIEDVIEDEHQGLFIKLADRVSYAMGTPINICIWLLIVIFWFVIFASGIVSSNASFMPAWFTGTSFNFPLNTVTTLLELFIGFLVAAAANRSERASKQLAVAQTRLLRSVKDEEDALAVGGKSMAELLIENTELTKLVKSQTDLLEEIHRHLTSLSPNAGNFAPPATPEH